MTLRYVISGGGRKSVLGCCDGIIDLLNALSRIAWNSAWAASTLPKRVTSWITCPGTPTMPKERWGFVWLLQRGDLVHGSACQLGGKDCASRSNSVAETGKLEVGIITPGMDA